MTAATARRRRFVWPALPRLRGLPGDCRHDPQCDPRCPGCRYRLRGTPPGGACGECGLPARDGCTAPELAAASPSHLRAMERGLVLAFVVLGLTPLITWVAVHPDVGRRAALVLVWGLGAAWCLALGHVAAAANRTEDPELRAAARPVAGLTYWALLPITMPLLALIQIVLAHHLGAVLARRTAVPRLDGRLTTAGLLAGVAAMALPLAPLAGRTPTLAVIVVLTGAVAWLAGQWWRLRIAVGEASAWSAHADARARARARTRAGDAAPATARPA